MANLYGVANPVGFPVYANAIGGANINCPAGVETNIIACALPAPISQGVYYLAGYCGPQIQMGATVPTSLTLGMRIGAGADIATIEWSSLLFTASGTIYLPAQMFATAPVLTPPFSPLTINFSLLPAAQAVTLLMFWSYAWTWYVRAPDQ